MLYNSVNFQDALTTTNNEVEKFNLITTPDLYNLNNTTEMKCIFYVFGLLSSENNY